MIVIKLKNAKEVVAQKQGRIQANILNRASSKSHA
jgi:hypothetical protein